MSNFYSTNDISFTFASINPNRLSELELEYMESLKEASLNETFRSYVEPLIFSLPEKAKDSKSLLVIVFNFPHAVFSLKYNDKTIDIPFASGYWNALPSQDSAFLHIRKAFNLDEKASVTPIGGMIPAKLLANRAGLVEYGRNNISYSDKFGSAHAIRVYATDAIIQESDWRSTQRMALCDTCSICVSSCPTGAIDMHKRVIDVGKCISLYNEGEGDFPEHIQKAKHSSLMGCLSCQAKCPVNKNHMNFIRLEGLNEVESKTLVEGLSDIEACTKIGEKLKIGSGEDVQGIITLLSRNTRAVLDSN